MKNNTFKLLNKLGMVLIGLGVCTIVFTKIFYLGIVLLTFGYFLYLKND